MSQITHEAIDALLESRTTTIARDLKLNLKRLLEESNLSPAEALYALLATAASVDHAPLVSHAKEKLSQLGITPEHIQEASECAAIMAMLNTYYRFRHMVQNETDYVTAGLRMTGLARPALGKQQFEMLALAVSVLNGCESCIRSHEKALRDSGVSADKIHDLARMASVVKALKTLSST